MGRRAIRRIDSSVDLTPFLTSLDALPSAWDGRDIFARDAPLEIDVGSGKGLFVTSAAASRPDANFLGVEISRKYARLSAFRIARRSLSNAHIICGDAQRLMMQVIRAESVSAVHIYFPDPWWKKRHHKRRIMNGAFVAAVERTLAPAGELRICTDVEEYFQSSVALVADRTRLVPAAADDPRPALHDMEYLTHFERRMRLNDRTVHRALFRKLAPSGQSAVRAAGARS